MRSFTRLCSVTFGMLLVLALSNCSSSGVVQTGPESYLVTTTGTSPAFTGTQDAIAKAYKEAGAFCTQRGLVVDTISLDKQEQALGRPGRAILNFQCVTPKKPAS